MSDLSIVEVTSEALDAAQAWWNSTDGLRTAEFKSLAQAFARHGASEAERVREACAKVADERAEMRQQLYEERPVTINAAKAVEAEEIAAAIRSLPIGGE